MRLLSLDRQRFTSLWVASAFYSSLLLCLFNFTGSIHLLSQERIKFEHLSIKDGLPQNTVFRILQDSRGFLWVGTENGLCRYDGYYFKPYQYDPEDTSSLSHNRVHAIFEDPSGTLWIGTESGLNKFDRRRERFTRYKHEAENPHKTLSNDNIRAVVEDHSGVLWVGTHGGGLNKFNAESQTFTAYKPNPPGCLQGSGTAAPDHCKITFVLEDSNHQLWVGTYDGLYTFYPEDEKFNRWNLPPTNSYKTCKDYITAIYEDPSHVLWFGTADGRLLQFNRHMQQFILFQFEPKIPLCQGEYQVRSIYEDNSGEFWIGVYNLGLYKSDPQKKTFTNYKEQPWIPGGLSNSHIHNIYQDKGGIIWIGTDDGLNKLDKKKNEFAHWTTEPGNKNSLSDNNVWAIYKDKTGILWIGTDKGLNRFDRETATFIHYTNDPQNPNTLSHNRVMAICQDHNGMLWLGTQGGGLNQLDKKTGTFTIYIPPPGYEPPPGITKNLNSVSHIRINPILEDHQGILWLGTQNGGLNKLDRQRKTFTHYMPDQKKSSESLSHGHVSSLFEDKTGILWVGTAAGLNEFNRETETFKHYKHDINDTKSLSDDYVSAIYEDQTGTLWVGTYFGSLNKLEDRDKGIFKHFRKKDGLPNETINGILEDEAGYLWISTVNGLSKFDPREETFKNYFASDGLQSNEFNGGACFKANDGEMFFGGVNGFNAFYPRRIKVNPYRPPIVITNFLVFNRPYLDTSIIEEKEVTLSHRESVFSIEFSALDFSIPAKNQYEHLMEGVDPDWVRGNAQKRFVTYTNLNPRTYTFRVRATNNDGIWSDREAVLKITITPPFWKTLWFQIFLGILFILIILTVYRMRTYRLRKKIAEQERIQDILKKSHDEMEMAKDLAELRHAENEKLLSAISSIFIAVDSKGKIFQWNKPAEKFFGIPFDKAVKKPFTEVLTDCIAENILYEITEMGLNQDQSAKMIEFSVDLKSGGKGIRVLASGVNPIRDSAGRTLGFLLLAEDITNRKEEEMLQNLSKKLESLGLMASSIAHEIKTPLQYIGHNAQFVSDSFDEVVQFYDMINDMSVELKKNHNKEIPPKIKGYIENHDMEFIMEEIPKASEQIISGVTRVSGIIQSMNEFSHPGKGVKDKADINQLLKSTLVMIQSKIKKNADIQLELAEDLPRIPCYAGELNQVFMNMLINALDAIIETSKWGLIKVSTHVEGPEVVVAISDTGCGISIENQDHIFNPFFTTKEVGKGTGQGLSLAHNVIIEKHKGKLDFTSREGLGTTFYIYLPIKGEN
ncbi:MAG: two-component regulator propeller domain-containing protein [Candidatus Aminicenantes bacterium]